MTETIDSVSAEQTDEPRLIAYLKGLEKRQDRAALAHLRRGLGKKEPKSVMEMYPYLGQFLSHETKHTYENAVFIVSALFAYYPAAPGNIGNLGASLRQLKDESDGIEKRFVALLNAEAEDLPYYLRQIIGLLKSKDVAVNWEQLFKDIQYWKSEQTDPRYESVQAKWARSFWGNQGKDKNNEKDEKTGGNEE